MEGALDRLTTLLGAAHVKSGADVSDDYSHDEALTAALAAPDVVVARRPAAEVAAVLQIAARPECR